MLNNQNNSAGGTPMPAPAMERNNLSEEADFVNAKAYLLTASTKTGLNL